MDFYKFLKTKSNITKSISNFKFNLLISELYQFIWNDFCDLYIELSKFSLKINEKKSLMKSLITLVIFLKLF